MLNLLSAEIATLSAYSKEEEKTVNSVYKEVIEKYYKRFSH